MRQLLRTGSKALVERGWRSITASAVFCSIFVLGVDTTFFRPGRVRAKAVAAAQTAVDEAVAAVANAKALHDREAPWYAPKTGAVDGLQGALADAERLLSNEETGAAGFLDEARGSSAADALALTQQASDKAIEVTRRARLITDALHKSATERSDARKGLARLRGGQAGLREQLHAVTTRFGTERAAYLTKYTTEIARQLQDAEQRHAETAAAVIAAEAALPPEADRSGEGNLPAAGRALETGNGFLNALRALVTTAAGRLDLLKEAEANAEQRRGEAAAAAARATAHIEAIRQQTGYFLQGPSERADRAHASLAACMTVLATSVEGSLVDKPAAYEAANASLEQSAAAVSEADAEVRRADAARKALETYGTRRSEVLRLIAQAQTAEATLRRHHAADAWQEVCTSVRDGQAALERARKAQEAARGHVDPAVQRFADAETSAERALAELATAEQHARRLVQVAADLEAFRKAYASRRDSAQRVVDSQSSSIEKYGSYDRTAKQNYADAVQLLGEAATAARHKRYRNAVDRADRASASADGTGSRAKRAHDRHEEEERARQRRQQSSSSDWDFSGGGGIGGSDSGGWSSSGGGSDFGSSSSSGGSWGGGSDSGWGGGSDSDW